MSEKIRSITGLALVGLAVCFVGSPWWDTASHAAGKIPVILDTDIGDDIDDTWALAFLLQIPELDVKLVVGDNGKPVYRAALIAKILEEMERTDIPVGMGVSTGSEDAGGPQAAWIEGYDLDAYPGTVLQDGVQALIETIMNSVVPVTLVAIGPVQNIRAALEREPRIAEKARFVGMHGSVRKGYAGSDTPCKEYNVLVDPESCRTVLSASWDVCITPLDTCGIVQLHGTNYRKVLNSESKAARIVMQNYRIWLEARNESAKFRTESSVLYDTVAVYLAFAGDLLEIERLGIRVTDDGMTVVDPEAKQIEVATRWKNLARFEELLVERLTGAKP